MATLKVATPFAVTLDPPSEDKPRDPKVADTYAFPVAGSYDDVPDEVASHWYTAMHLEGYEAPAEPGSGGIKVMEPAPEPPPPAANRAAAAQHAAAQHGTKSA